MKLRLLSYNIRLGGRGREEKLAEVIRSAQPDVVMLQEAGDRDVVARLSQLTEMPHWDARPNHSTAFLSRVNIAHHDWEQPRGARHAFLEVAINEPGVRIFGLHLSAWFSNWSERRRYFEIQALLHAIKEHQHGMHLIVGDFNALAPGEILKSDNMPRWIRGLLWLSGRDIARTTIQHMLDQHYLDIWRALNDGDNGFTFPTWDPNVRLDYVFTPDRYRTAVVSCEVLRAPAVVLSASDHFPLFAEIDLTR